jgi:hypothetical protein
MTLIAFDIFVLHARPSTNFHIGVLTQLLSDLGLKKITLMQEDFSKDFSRFLPFIISRILILFSPKSHLIPSHYVQFAIQCAKLVSEKVQ